MAIEKAPNYSKAQEDILLEVAGENGGVLNLENAKALAADPRMGTADGSARNYRSIVAKIGRMSATHPELIRYETKQPETKKDGVKKSDLVARIAAVVAGNMDGLDKAKLPALVAIASFVESIPTVGFELDEGEAVAA